MSESKEPKVKKPVRSQAILQVVRTEWVSEHLIRVVAGGPGFEHFNDNEFSDKYVKVLIPPLGSTLRPPYDLAEIRAEQPEQLPARRTYTVRWVDQAQQQIAIDFVVHGTEGVAGPWAAGAKPGDELVVTGAGGGYLPSAESDWHLLVGDDSAIPAIASSLESMPSEAKGVAIIAVSGEGDKVSVTAPAGIEVRWVFHEGIPADALPGELNALEWLPGTPQVFAHGERESIKQVRKIFAERGVEKRNLSISAYWARGRIEDAFQAEKREPIGQIETS
ncbi:siderophore-interacting protein [Humidisolicoccus flavus]|uniref:siderophore-interacting protein n=1 Tax=Humidisolicoccus flavus TaxID=3111414 RepID=UPI00324EE415